MSDVIQSDVNTRETTRKERILFGLSALTDQASYQFFTLAIFVFYFAIAFEDAGPEAIGLVWIAYVIWGVWNMFNDPLLGALSERTKQRARFGKRKLYLIVSIVPLSVIMILLFSVPLTASTAVKFIYFLVVILIFELIYTMYSVNTNALFPEQFPDAKERAKVNQFIKSFTVLAVILATMIPFLVIGPLAPGPEVTITLAIRQTYQLSYIITGVIMALVVIIPGLIFIKYGVKEPKEDHKSFKQRPSFLSSLKFTLKNRNFLKFTIANMFIWTCFSILLMVFPLYSIFVLGFSEGALLTSLSLMLALIIAACTLPLHKRIGERIGSRNGLMLALGLWIGILLPFMFLTDSVSMQYISIGVTALQGIPLGGALFFVDLLISDVVDQDELKFGVKRSASYYGINAFVHRFSIIISISVIALVFSGASWSSFSAWVPGTEVIALKILMFVCPALACACAILFLRWYDLHGKKLKDMREKLRQART